MSLPSHYQHPQPCPDLALHLLRQNNALTFSITLLFTVKEAASIINNSSISSQMTNTIIVCLGVKCYMTAIKYYWVVKASIYETF